MTRATLGEVRDLLAGLPVPGLAVFGAVPDSWPVEVTTAAKRARGRGCSGEVVVRFRVVTRREALGR